VVGAIYLPPYWKAYRTRVHLQGLMPAIKNDSPAPDVIAYEDDPTRAAAIGRTKEYLTIGAWDNKTRLVRLPAAWFELRYERWGWWDSPTADKPILFLHSRKNHAGVERVLVFYGVPTWPGGATSVTVHTLVLDANGDAWHPPLQWDGGSTVTLARDGKSKGNGLRIFAGQADANDPSHFTIEYEIDVVKNKIDGWLQDSYSPYAGETVQFKLR
jgi:hypothetical protein